LAPADGYGLTAYSTNGPPSPKSTLLFHLDRTRAVLSRTRESSARVIGLLSSKLRVECRSCKVFATGEIVFGCEAENFRKSIFFPGQRGRTAGSGATTPA